MKEAQERAGATNAPYWAAITPFPSRGSWSNLKLSPHTVNDLCVSLPLANLLLPQDQRPPPCLGGNAQGPQENYTCFRQRWAAGIRLACPLEMHFRKQVLLEIQQKTAKGGPLRKGRPRHTNLCLDRCTVQGSSAARENPDTQGKPRAKGHGRAFRESQTDGVC